MLGGQKRSATHAKQCVITYAAARSVRMGASSYDAAALLARPWRILASAGLCTRKKAYIGPHHVTKSMFCSRQMPAWQKQPMKPTKRTDRTGLGGECWVA